MPPRPLTPEGQMLQEILNYLTGDNRHGKLDQELHDIQARIGDNEKSITVISATMDNVGKVLIEFSEAVKGLREDQLAHWKNQDRLMAQNESILKQLADSADSFKTINKRQTEIGCPWVINEIEKRNMILKVIEADISRLNIASRKSRDESEQLEDRIIKLEEEKRTLNTSVINLTNRLDPIEQAPLNTFKKIKDLIVSNITTAVIIIVLAYFGFKKG